MTGSRMINTLAALLAALTVGTIILMAMETAPIRPEIHDLIARSPDTPDLTEIIRQTDVPVQPAAWRNIVVTAADTPDKADSHFVVDVGPDGRTMISATALWKKQGHPQLISGANASFNDTLITICVIGDFSSAPPGRGQYRSLVDLVRTLQFAFRVSPGHVYLHSDLSAYSRLPGRGFPADDFNSTLIRIRP